MTSLRWGLVGGLLTALVSVRCDDALVHYTIPEPVPDAAVAATDAGTPAREDASAPAEPGDASADPSDASTDAGDAAAALSPEALCAQKEERFAQFVADNRSCSIDADCVVIGDCDANADWAVVRASAAEAGYTLMRARCLGIADGPTHAPRCSGGQCTLGEENGCCGCPADGGL